MGKQKQPDVVFYEAFEEEEAAIRRYLPASVRAYFTAATPQEEPCTDLPAPIISTRTQSVLPPEWGKDVQAILTRSTGYDHILAYRARTVTPAALGYLPLYCNRAVAEQAMLLWMALLRRLPRQLNQFRTFHRDGITGCECREKTLLVAGVGHIGGEVVDIGRGLGMTVLGVDPVIKRQDVDYVSIEDGISRADVIVCSMNLTEKNRGFFNRDLLKQARRGAIFVNIARGELAVPADLRELLDAGILGGVGMDVYDNEPELAVALRSGRSSSNPSVSVILDLFGRDNVICTPHNAFNTVESVERKSSQSVDQIQHFLEHRAFLWPVPE